MDDEQMEPQVFALPAPSSRWGPGMGSAPRFSSRQFDAVLGRGESGEPARAVNRLTKDGRPTFIAHPRASQVTRRAGEDLYGVMFDASRAHDSDPHDVEGMQRLFSGVPSPHFSDLIDRLLTPVSNHPTRWHSN